MKIYNAKLRNKEGLYTLIVENGCFSEILLQDEKIKNTEDKSFDADENLLCPPFVEPHIHLDAALTAGEPNWNLSGTLFEGIERWSERKEFLTYDDVKNRALETINLLINNGVQFIRTHADITDPDLVGLKALCDLRDQLSEKIDIQVVAFPQEGFYSFEGADKLMRDALEYGADVIGGIPHFEFTRELGVDSVKALVNLAIEYNKLIDIHCDEIDDPESRFLEVLAYEAYSRGIGKKVTASHTTAMHSYNNAYCSKLFRLLKKSEINFISCPTESLHLQGRHDTYPKRRGITRVKELNKAGMNVCLGQDSIFDPWYSLGNGKLLRTLDFALHVCHMMGYEDYKSALDFITINGAKALNIDLENNYGIEIGKRASFIVLEGSDDYSVIRKQGEVLLSVRKGKVLMKRIPSRIVDLHN